MEPHGIKASRIIRWVRVMLRWAFRSVRESFGLHHGDCLLPVILLVPDGSFEPCPERLLHPATGRRRDLERREIQSGGRFDAREQRILQILESRNASGISRL